MAHPAILRNLVEQYEALHVLQGEEDTSETRQRIEDVTYTLCVSTGTQTVEAALAAAEQHLAGARSAAAQAAVERTAAGGPDVLLTA